MVRWPKSVRRMDKRRSQVVVVQQCRCQVEATFRRQHSDMGGEVTANGGVMHGPCSTTPTGVRARVPASMPSTQRRCPGWETHGVRDVHSLIRNK